LSTTPFRSMSGSESTREVLSYGQRNSASFILVMMADLYPGFDIQAARENWKKRIDNRTRQRRELWEKANAEADRAIALIIERYQPKRVIQWGSVLRPERFTEISDIDIAVEGITDPETWSHLERDVLAIVSFPLHLIPFGQVIPVHQQDILSRGRVIYERTN